LLKDVELINVTLVEYLINQLKNGGEEEVKLAIKALKSVDQDY